MIMESHGVFQHLLNPIQKKINLFNSFPLLPLPNFTGTIYLIILILLAFIYSFFKKNSNQRNFGPTKGVRLISRSNNGGENFTDFSQDNQLVEPVFILFPLFIYFFIK